MLHSTHSRDGVGREISISVNDGISQVGGFAAIPSSPKWKDLMSKLEEKLAPFLPNDDRRQASCDYSQFFMVQARVGALLCGYEDLNDFQKLNRDPAFLAGFGVDKVPSAATLCLFEKQISQKACDAIGEFFLENFPLPESAEGKSPLVILDADNTPVPGYGTQEGLQYNGHYRCKCYLPLILFCNEYPIEIFNAPGNKDGRKKLETELGGIVEAIRKRAPNALIVLRADGGFNSTELVRQCEELGIFYVMGLPKNQGLAKAMEKWIPNWYEIVKGREGSVLRSLGPIDYQAKSWGAPRRVIARDVYSDYLREFDARFIQTNIPSEDNGKCGDLWKLTDQELYDDFFCSRGLAEKFNGELKYQSFAARVSSHSFETNTYRMMLGALCLMMTRLLQADFPHPERKDRWRPDKEETAEKAVPQPNYWSICEPETFRAVFIRVPSFIRSFKNTLQIILQPKECGMESLKLYWDFQT